ncbi:MAG: response regulator, partial [Pseudomonadota bacterium]
DKYSRSSRKGTKGEKGTGLGMSIVREIVKLHNGEVKVDSRLGRGSVFTITLPFFQEALLADDPGLTKAGDPNQTVANSKPSKILLVEDNPVNVKFTSALLERSGHTVTPVENGWAAIALIMEQDYDLILMDIEMPDLNGFEACEKIRALGHTDIPIVALTGHSIETVQDKLKKAGMTDFLLKPCDPQQMNDMLTKWLSE